MVDMRFAQKAVKSLWKDKLTVVEHQKTKKENGVTGFIDVVVLKDEPCRLSFKRVAAANQQEAAKLAQSVNLICDKTLGIKPGSKLSVLHEGVVTAYKQSGKAAVYSAHQEIELNLFERWA